VIVDVPAVLLLGVITWLLYRARSVRVLDVVIVAGFGFFLARTTFAGPIARLFASIGHALIHL
jgi:hypothetical protein